MKIENVKEMMVQRNFKEYKSNENYIIGINHNRQYIYIKIYETKFELNTVREFLKLKFILNDNEIYTKSTKKHVVQLVIICKSFQKSHVKEFRETYSKNIQIIRSDFFNINITKKAPLHQKVDDLTFIKNKRELPIIKSDDPNCIFYNFSKGDVIRVIRSDGDICYRLVK
jgi:DNA-directed RNA polymerase subunit H (RpoH/RPB5)